MAPPPGNPRFLFYDYETWGLDTRLDRPASFAALRTDADLNIVGEPLEFWCRPPVDRLPSPDACLLTGITPFKAEADGVCEAEFFRRVNAEMLRFPGTCCLGFNTLAFDDEMTRNGLYRNLMDPYEREWRNGNSRWDALPFTRLVAALRPSRIEWPEHPETGLPAFNLERLAQANGIGHGQAHDALSDVRATIGWMRLLKERKPNLWAAAFAAHTKAGSQRLLEIGRPVIHVATPHGPESRYLACVVPVAKDAVDANSYLAFNLSADPHKLRDAQWVGARGRDGEGAPPGLVSIKANKSPALADFRLFDESLAGRLGLDYWVVMRNAARLEGMMENASHPFAEIQQAVRQAFAKEYAGPDDPDLALYSGGFIGPTDRRRLERLSSITDPAAMRDAPTLFDDAGRLDEMWLRYRARNHFPDALTADEQGRWRAAVAERLGLGRAEPDPKGRDFLGYFKRINELAGDAGTRERIILLELVRHGLGCARFVGVDVDFYLEKAKAGLTGLSAADTSADDGPGQGMPL